MITMKCVRSLTPDRVALYEQGVAMLEQRAQVERRLGPLFETRVPAQFPLTLSILAPTAPSFSST